MPRRAPLPPTSAAFDETRLTTRRPQAGLGYVLLWILNIVVFVAALVWIFSDPLGAAAFANPNDAYAEFPQAHTSHYAMATVVMLVAILSIFAFALGLFVGPRTQRSLRSWLALTALVACWLAFFASWREFAWAGRRWRLAPQVEALMPLAARLNANWPTAGGTMSGLGHFSTHALSRPSTLLVIAAETPPTHLPISRIERTDAGSLIFQLAGDEYGACLQWQPAGDPPATFTNGLGNEQSLERASPLRDGWYLVRYREYGDVPPQFSSRPVRTP